MITKVCAICESSCSDEHKYKIDNKEYYVCNLHYKLLKAMYNEFALEAYKEIYNTEKTKKTKNTLKSENLQK